jgi:hypothetical protein
MDFLKKIRNLLSDISLTNEALFQTLEAVLK